MSAGYPLEALRVLRAEEEELAQRAMAERLARLEAATSRLDAARQAVTTHGQETARTLAAERERPLAQLRADDAVRVRAWRERRATELSVLERAVAGAVVARDAAEAEVESAREALAAAGREREAIERHHARWLEEARKRAEAREEADAEERRR